MSSTSGVQPQPPLTSTLPPSPPLPPPPGSSAQIPPHQSSDHFAKRVKDAQGSEKQLNSLLNPSKFHDLAKSIFPRRPLVQEFLKEYYVQEVWYCEVWPVNSTKELVDFARSSECPIHTTLKMYISMPKTVYKTSKPMKLKLSVDFHGGGGFTGCAMFEPWIYLPRLKNILEIGDILSIEIQYPLMPQSDGEEIVEAIEEAHTWLFENLERTLRAINPNLGVAWESFNLSGHSFGGSLALIALSMIMRHPKKPDTLRVKTVHGRSVVSKEYTRSPGMYMGVAVPQQEANKYATALHIVMESFMKDAHVVKKCSGRKPPDGMLLAYATSSCNIKGAKWIDFWRHLTAYEFLEKATDFPEGVKIFLEHGTKDINVPYQDTVDLANMLKAKSLAFDIEYVLHDGKDHAGDYNRDPSELRGFFDLY